MRTQLHALARQVRAQRPEVKFLDAAKSATNILNSSTVWTGSELNPTSASFVTCTQGTGVEQRIGERIRVLSILIQGVIVMPAQANQAGADSAPSIVLVLVQDRLCDGTEFQGEDVFENPSADANVAMMPLRVKKFQHKYKVLKQITLNVPQPTVVYDGTNIEQGGVHIPFKIYHDFGPAGLDVHYNLNGGTVADLDSNSVGLLGHQSNGAQCNIAYNYRTRFTDV